MIATTSRFLYLFTACLFLGCFNADVKTGKTQPQGFPVEKKVNEAELLKTNELSPDYIDLYKDSIICLVSARGANGYHIAPYHLTEKTFLQPKVPAGGKEGKALSIGSLGFGNEYCWSYDRNKEKIIFTGLDNLRDTSNHFLKEIDIPGFHYSVQLLNDSTALTGGNYYADDNFQLSIMNLVNGKIINQWAPYGNDSSSHYNMAQKTAYESLVFVKPSKDKCVVAYRYADRIEIVDLLSGKTNMVNGPEGYDPDMKVITGHDGKKISIRSSDTRQAFVRGKVTDNFIYLLYSGNKDGTPHRFYGKYVYVYDWEGRPVQRLELTNYSMDIAVTSNDAILYTYNPVSGSIHVAKLKN